MEINFDLRWAYVLIMAMVGITLSVGLVLIWRTPKKKINGDMFAKNDIDKKIDDLQSQLNDALRLIDQLKHTTDFRNSSGRKARRKYIQSHPHR